MPDSMLLPLSGDRNTPRALSFAMLLLALTFTVGAALLPATASASLAVTAREPRWAQSLNGQWQFKYIAGSAAGAEESFHQPDFAAAGWDMTPVPSNWEMHGYATPKYASPAEGTGFYRRTFRVPSEWDGRRVFLRFEGVLYGFDAWINGRPVGSWASSFNAVTFDVTDAVARDRDNLLAVRVSTRAKGWEFDTNDCWGLSGIYRDVILFSAPATRVRDYTATTTLQPEGGATLRIRAEVARSAEAGEVSLRGVLRAPGNGAAQEFALNFSSPEEAEATVRIAQAQRWTAETPALYSLELELTKSGAIIDRVREKIGVREVSIVDGVLMLNGVAIKMRGANHHDIWPEVGRAGLEADIRRDLELMREANINFVRTSHYPSHPRLIELCDEMGFYVMCEVSFGFGDRLLTDEAYRETLMIRAQATVDRDKNRPSVIIWSVGNENPITPMMLDTGREVKRLDPTRPICFPTVGSYFDGHWKEFPEFVDIYAPHYPNLATLQNYTTMLQRPTIISEYAHALGLATDRIQDEWELMQKSPRLAGGAVWMFQDQGIRRKAAQPVDVNQPTTYAWPDAQSYFDTQQMDGCDGVVYSDRTPQDDYWQLRKVYSPVQIVERELAVRPGKNSVTLQVENRHDFRSLEGMSFEWEVRRNRETLQRGTHPLRGPAKATEKATLQLDVPSANAGDVTFLALRVRERDGRSIHERAIRLKASEVAAPTAATLVAGAGATNALSLAESETEIRVTTAGGDVRVDRRSGETSVRQGERVVIAGIWPHFGRKFTLADKARAGRNNNSITWPGTYLKAPTNVAVEVQRAPESVSLTVRGRYARPDNAEQFLDGFHRVVIGRDGTIGVSYDYTPVDARGAVLEAGLTMIAPAELSELRWIGAGPWAGYPGKDRLNEFGLHHLSRADIRFQGNRREVDVATLSDPAGNGFALVGGASDVAVERDGNSTLLSHNALVSGRGNKGVPAETRFDAAKVEHVRGSFTLALLEAKWPEPMRRWFGAPGAATDVQRPFVHSYDQ